MQRVRSYDERKAGAVDGDDDPERRVSLDSTGNPKRRTSFDFTSFFERGTTRTHTKAGLSRQAGQRARGASGMSFNQAPSSVDPFRMSIDEEAVSHTLRGSNVRFTPMLQGVASSIGMSSIPSEAAEQVEEEVKTPSQAVVCGIIVGCPV